MRAYVRQRLKTHLLAIALLALIVSPPSLLLAQSASPWMLLPGRLLDVAINGAAQAYAVSRTGEALRWRADDQRWSKMSGQFVRITGAEGNRPWAVNDKGVVMRFNGLWWEPKGNQVTDVAGDAVGNVFIASFDGRIRKWEPLSGSWRTMSGLAKRIALDDRGNPWVVAPDNRIYRYFDDQWQSLPGFARDIAVAADGTAMIADTEGNVRVWRTNTASWDSVPGVADVLALAATPNGGTWAVRTNGSILATVLISSQNAPVEPPEEAQQAQAPQAQAPQIFAPTIVAPIAQASTATASVSQATTSQASQAQAPSANASANASNTGGQGTAQSTASSSVSPSSGGGSGDPAAQTTTEEFTFTDTRNTAARIEIGKDGSVFALITGGAIRRWSNERRRFEDFPGQLARLAIDVDGNPWGVTGLGRVFRHNGLTWKQIFGATASDLSIGADGSVVTADAGGLLAKFNPVNGRFERISGRGVQVAVAPDGSPWTIRDDSAVQNCGIDPCETVNERARNISIGPDGSVFLVSTNDQLLRKRPGSDDFERILVPGHISNDVAVGPRGFPWIVSSAGKVLSAKFFERDESDDRTLALRTTTETTGIGATAAVVSSQSSSGFTFTKNMRFDSFKSSDPDANLSTLRDIAVGQDNSVFIHDFSSVFEFNDRNDKFEALDTTFPASVRDVSTDANGVIWGLSFSSPAKVYRIKGSQVKTFTVTNETTGKSRNNLAVDGDGTVYAAVGTSIYVKDPDGSTFSEDFEDKSVRRVALAGGGDIWIINQSGIVQQWTGARFENRPTGTGQSADDIAAGSDGTVFVVNSNKLLRWNATNTSFDEVNSTLSFNKVGVTNQGRPWGVDTSGGGGGGQGGGSSSTAENIFRAKD